MSTGLIIFLTAWLSSGLTVWLGSLFSGELANKQHPRMILLISFLMAITLSGVGVMLVGVGMKMGRPSGAK